jgi:phage tail-like protein
MIPERNTYWLLDSVAGWKMTPKPADNIRLDPLPGSASFLPTSLSGSISCPVALGSGSKDNIFVMDAATSRVTILNLSTSITRPIQAFGGRGEQLRRFNSPRSLTILPSGSIAIADTGNRRVQLFSRPPYVLLHVWGAPEVTMKPVAVASDHSGIVYIADGESHAILRVRRSGEWLRPIGAGILTDPIELAVAPDQTLAVIDRKAANTSILIFPPAGAKPVRLALPAAPLSLVFDNSGNLYAGTANAIVSKLQPDATQLSGWSLSGAGVSDADGTIVKLTWLEAQGLIGILNSPTPGGSPRLFSMNPSGAYSLTGTFVTDWLDSNIETCSWHRVRIVGDVPDSTSVLISSSTRADKKTIPTPLVSCGVLGGKSLDCLVQSPPGRYLQLTVRLQSSGLVTPTIQSIQVFFPRKSYLQYLPSVFSDDDESRLFLDRFLSIFQTTFDQLDERLDNLWQLFDPLMTPANVFPWLAAWIALPIDPTMPLSRQRQLLKGAFDSYLIRGTPAGLEQVIEAYTGVANIKILEHFKLRNWTFLPVSGGLREGSRLWSRSFHSRLQVGVQSTLGQFTLANAPPPASEPYEWGANQFTVFFPANPYTATDRAEAIQTVLDREKPAYTQAFLTPIFPRLRLGVQATLGMDAYVGTANAMILGRLGTLNYDSVLAPSQEARDIQALGLSTYPRVGREARIL